MATATRPKPTAPRAVPDAPAKGKTIDVAGRKVKPEMLVYGAAGIAALVVVVKRKGSGSSKAAGKTTTLVGAGGAGTLNTTATDLTGFQDSLSRQISDGFGRLMEDQKRTDMLGVGDDGAPYWGHAGIGRTPAPGSVGISADDPAITTPESSVGIVAVTPASGGVIRSPNTTPAPNPTPAQVASVTASPGATSWKLPSGLTDPAFVEQVTAAQQATQSPANAAANLGFLKTIDDAPWGQWTPNGYV